MKSGVINTTTAGFFSNFRGTVSSFKKCEELGLTPVVKWGKQSPYYESKYGENVWDYYFDPLTNDSSDEIPVNQDFSWKNLSHTRKKMYELIRKYVIVKKEITDEVNSFYENNFKGKNVLGVHIRLTDKSTASTEKDTIVSSEKYIKHIDSYLKNNDNSVVFVCTDSTDYINDLKSLFGDRLLMKDDTLRTSGVKSIHHHTSGNGFLKGKEVLIDMLLLSKCDFLIKGISNVSLCTLFFNKGLEHFNIASYYNNDTREDFIESTLIKKNENT